MARNKSQPLANLDAIIRAAEDFFRHHGHHPDESCCVACEPLKDAIWKAYNEERVRR